MHWKHPQESSSRRSDAQPITSLETTMSRSSCLLTAAALTAAVLGGTTQAQQPAASAEKPPLFATTKVDGTDNVYVFRYGNHQSMFVVTSDGVIATDPI